MNKNEYIHTGLYHLPIRGVDIEVAHIYEYLLLETFKHSLEKHGFSKYLFGWVGGETFRDVIFIEYGFYDQKVEKIFQKFMQESQRIDISFLNNELLRVQAEARVTITDLNKAELMRQLHQLDNDTFINHANNTEIALPKTTQNDIKPDVVKMRKSKSKFRTIAITLGIRNMTVDEKKAFLRLSPILHEAIDNCVFKLGAYNDDSSWAIGKPVLDGMLVVSINTMKRGDSTNKQIEKNLRHSLESLAIDIKQRPDELQSYIQGFLTTPNWNNFAVDYYRNTGIITTKQQIAESLTQERIASLISRIEIEICLATEDHWSLV